jgi:hypothetical protein
MPDWLSLSSQAWQGLGLLAGLTFVASLIGHSLTRNAFAGAIIAVVIFVAVYIAWDYYPPLQSYLPDWRFPKHL